MKSQEEVVTRARLIASGVIRWWQWDKSRDVHLWMDIMAKELANIKDPDIVVNIRESLRRHGLHVPELPLPERTNDFDKGVTEKDSGSRSGNDQHNSARSPVLYVRRAPNQVSEYTEVHIRELLSRGLSKSAVARALRVNRRVVIRVARETQSAQQDQNQDTNDLGTISEGR